MMQIADTLSLLKSTGCTINETSVPAELSYISFDKEYVDEKLDHFAKTPSNEYPYIQAFEMIYKSKKNRYCPSVIGNNHQLFKVEKLYALNITPTFIQFVLGTLSGTVSTGYGSTYIELDKISAAVSNMIGKEVYVLSPTAYHKDYKLWSSATRQYLTNLTKIYLVCLDDLTPTNPVTSTKRAESIYKRKRSREADKKIFEVFFKPIMKATLDEAGFYYDDHTKKVYTNSVKFTNWINKFVEAEVISKLKEIGIDARINPKGYYSGAAYPITIKGVNKEMLDSCAKQIEGELDGKE